MFIVIRQYTGSVKKNTLLITSVSPQIFSLFRHTLGFILVK